MSLPSRRLLFVNQFYAPDPAPTGQHLADLTRVLVARGHAVTVLTSRRSYSGGPPHPRHETIDGVRVRRLPALAHGRQREGRFGSWLSFYASAGAYLFSRRLHADLLLCLTTPPFLGLLGAARGRLSRKPVAHWVMDLYPDALFAHGLVSREGVRARVLTSLARRSYRSASLVLTPGPFMQRAVARYAAPGTTQASVPLWGPEAGAVSPDEVARVRAERGWGERDVVFLYSGNMGLGHRLAEFLAAARTGEPREAVWCFLGGGARRAEVEEAARASPQARIQVLPYVVPGQVAASLAAADVHLVSLRREWQGLIVPSKLQAAFSVGRPVVFVGPEDNESALWIRQSGGGWRVDEDDVKGLRAAVREACRPSEWAERGTRALQFAKEHFDRERNCARIADLLEACVEGDRRSRSTP